MEETDVALQCLSETEILVRSQAIVAKSIFVSRFVGDDPVSHCQYNMAQSHIKNKG